MTQEHLLVDGNLWESLNLWDARMLFQEMNLWDVRPFQEAVVPASGPEVCLVLVLLEVVLTVRGLVRCVSLTLSLSLSLLHRMLMSSCSSITCVSLLFLHLVFLFLFLIHCLCACRYSQGSGYHVHFCPRPCSSTCRWANFSTHRHSGPHSVCNPCSRANLGLVSTG